MAHVYRTLCVTEKVQEIAGASKTYAIIRIRTLEAELLAVLILVEAARTLS